eukprot:2251465-Amphidinium_carterae.1
MKARCSIEACSPMKRQSETEIKTYPTALNTLKEEWPCSSRQKTKQDRKDKTRLTTAFTSSV